MDTARLRISPVEVGVFHVVWDPARIGGFHIGSRRETGEARHSRLRTADRRLDTFPAVKAIYHFAKTYCGLSFVVSRQFLFFRAANRHRQTTGRARQLKGQREVFGYGLGFFIPPGFCGKAHR